MTYQATLLTTYKNNAGTFASGQISVTGGDEDDFSFTVAAATTNDSHPLALAVATMGGVCLISDVPVTIKTNSTSAPGNTITLAAGVPLAWMTGAAGANPFTVDVTALYITNAGTAPAHVQMSINRSV